MMLCDGALELLFCFLRSISENIGVVSAYDFFSSFIFCNIYRSFSCFCSILPIVVGFMQPRK